jgi:predicted NBD/HSP70 family sugar kinase
MHTDMSDTLSSLREEAKFILGIILRKGPMTRTDMLDLSKMKLSTLNRVIQPLLDSGMISEVSVGESTGGRKPSLYGINPRWAFYIGIDISRTYTQLVVTDFCLDIIDSCRVPMTEDTTPNVLLQLAADYIKDAINRLSVDMKRVVGIGIGTVGPMDRKRGLLLNPKGFLASGWANIDLKDKAEEMTNMPVIIDNGANMAVLAEYLFGEGRGYDNIAYINCGVGIRTGVISEGTIVRPINDAEDAFGHMIIDIDGQPCSCGNFGCVESYASVPAILSSFISGLKRGRSSSVFTGDSFRSIDIKDISYIDICSAADKGDELAREVILNAASAFGVGLSNYIRLLSPRLVILSGPLAMNSRLFYETCIDTAVKRMGAREENDNGIDFRRGGFYKENAMAAGAAVSVANSVLGIIGSGGIKC